MEGYTIMEIVEKCRGCRKKCDDCEIYRAYRLGYREGTLEQSRSYEKRYKNAIALYDIVKDMISEKLNE